MRIAAVQPLSLIDFPEMLSSVVFTVGCNFRCPFCQNPSLVNVSADLPLVPDEEVFETLRSHRGWVEGVVITGGEPTLQDDLFEFVQRVNAEGFKVKLDTNGSRPDIVERLIEHHLVDYVALDIKTSKEKYSLACGVPVDISAIEKTIVLLATKLHPRCEFRTTAVPTMVGKDDIERIGQWISSLVPSTTRYRYFLQQFSPTTTLDPRVGTVPPYTREELEELRACASLFFDARVRV